MTQIFAKICFLQTLFFLEPNGYYNYPPHLFRRPLTESFVEERQRTQLLYKKLLARAGVMARTIDLSGLFEKWGERKALVDDIHFSPAFGEFLAQQVANYIDLKSLAQQASDSHEPTSAEQKSLPGPGK